MTLTAITRKVSPAIADCELTHLERVPIDYAVASQQHVAYERLLGDLGCDVVSLAAEEDLPDSVFVEDAAIVLDEIAVIMRPGAESRRPERSSIADALRPYRNLAFISEPATIDGGDVLLLGKRLWVGLTTRTSQDGVDQLRSLLTPHSYSVQCLDLLTKNRGTEAASSPHCLHLKTAVTAVGPASVLLDPRWIDPAVFADYDVIEVDPSEPFASNALLVNETVVLSTAFPLTRRRLEEAGFDVVTIDATELAKAEGGLTCCSLIFREAVESRKWKV